MEKQITPIGTQTPPPPTRLKKALVITGVFVYLFLLGYFVGAGLAQSIKPILH